MVKWLDLRRVLSIAKNYYLDVYNKIFFRGALRGNFFDRNRSVRIFLNSDKSVLRWGDGESQIYFGEDLNFQKNSEELRDIFGKIIREQRDPHNDKPYMFAMNHERFACSTSELQRLGRYETWKKSRYLYQKKMNKSVPCYSAFVFKGLTRELYVEIVEKILGYESLIVVCSKMEIVDEFFKQYNYHGKIYRVKIDDSNAFEQYGKIKQEIFRALSHEKERKSAILVAAGPLAKCICYELSWKGFLVFDVGKFFYSEYPRYKSVTIKRQQKVSLMRVEKSQEYRVESAEWRRR